MLDRPLDESYILTFLQQNKLATISTVNQNNEPDAAPIFYVIDYTFTIHFVTAAQSQKKMNIDVHNKVVLTITDEKNGETVQIRGIASEDNDQLDKTYEELAKKLNYTTGFMQTLPALKHKEQNMKAIRIAPYEIRMRIYDVDRFDEKIIVK